MVRSPITEFLDGGGHEGSSGGPGAEEMEMEMATGWERARRQRLRKDEELLSDVSRALRYFAHYWLSATQLQIFHKQGPDLKHVLPSRYPPS